MGALKQKMMELETMDVEDLEPTEIDLKKDMLTHTLEVTVADLLHLDVSPKQIRDTVEAVISRGFPAKLEGPCLLYTSDACRRLLTCRSRWSPYH